MAIITGINAGTTTITATYGGKSAEATITVNSIVPTLSFTVNSATLTYDGTPKVLGSVSYDGDGTAYYIVSTSNTVPSTNDPGWSAVPSNNEITYTGAGTYYVHLKATAGTNYSDVSPKIGNNDGKQISKRTVTVTAPAFVSGTLTYDGTPQTIASGGSCSAGGTMYYYVSTSSTAPTVQPGSAPGSGWTTTAPEVNDAGTYYVWYYCYVPDTNNNTGTNINTVKAVSGTKSMSSRTVTVTAPTGSTETYNTVAQTIFTAGSCSDGGVMYYSATGGDFSTSTWSTTIPNAEQTNAGEYTLYYYCYVSDTVNNTGTDINTKKSVKATISKRKALAPILTSGGNSVYTGETYYAKAANTSGNPSGKIYYGETSGATTYNITASSTAANLTSMGRSDTGTTTIYAFFRPDDTANYSDSDVNSTTVTISNKANGFATAELTNRTYTGSSQVIAEKVTNSGDYYFGLGASAAAAPTSWGAKNTDMSQTASGTYYVWMKTDESTNYSAVSKYIGTVTVSKRTVTFTAPVTYDRTYTGSAQTVFTAGSCSDGGVMYYSANGGTFSTSTWTTTIPNASQTNAGEYTLYYYCYVSDTSNNMGDGINMTQTVTATINKKATSAPALTDGIKEVYDGTYVYAKAANVAGNPSGKIYYGDSAGVTTYNITVAAGATTPVNLSQAGRYNYGSRTIHAFFRPDDTSNYLDSADATAVAQVVAKASGYVSADLTDATYTGASQTVAVVDRNSGDYYFGLGSSASSAPSSWGAKNTPLSVTDAGEYYVWMKADSASNYNSVSATYIGKVTVSKRTVTVTAPTSTDRTYNGSAQTIFTAGSCSDGGEMYYSETNIPFSTSSWSKTLPYTEKTNAGDYTIYWYCYVPDTNNNTGSGINTPTSVEATISKLSTSAPTLTAGTKTTYDGTSVYAKAANVSGNPAGKIYYGISSGAETYNVSVASGVTSAVDLTGIGQTNVGTTTIYAFFRPDDLTNYSDSAITSTTVSVSGKANLTVSETNYHGAYDGQTHYCSITVTTSGWTGTIETGESEGSYQVFTDAGVSNTEYTLNGEQSVSGYPVITYYRVVGGDNYNDYTGSVEIEITSANGYVTANISNKTYSGSAQTIATISTNSGDYYFGLGSSASVAPATWGTKNTALTVIDAGEYYVWAKTDSTNNYNAVSPTYIGKATVSPRTVKIRPGIIGYNVYTGSPQMVFTADSCGAGGVMYFYDGVTSNFDKTTWTTTFPYTQKTDAGTYNISFYCLVEDTRNNVAAAGSEINTIYTKTAEIYKAASTLPVTWEGDSKKYHGTAELTAVDYSGGTLKYRYDVNNGTNWTETTVAPTRTELGTTAVECKVMGDANHEDSSWSSTVTLTIVAADDARMTVAVGSGLTYDGTAKDIATASNLDGVMTYYLGYTVNAEATAESQITWGGANESPLQATDAGTYYIYYKFSPDANHSNSNVGTVGDATYVGSTSISKVQRSGAVSCEDVTYGSTVTATVSGNSAGGTVTWSITNGTGSATIDSNGLITPTQAGTVTVNANVGATANYEAYTATPKTITISQAPGTVTYVTERNVQVYCTELAVASNVTDSSKELTISENGATNSIGTLTYSISKNGWTISNDGRKIVIPSGTDAGVYNISVTVRDSGSVNYMSKNVTKLITVTVIEQELVRIELTLGQSTISFNGTTNATVKAVYTSGAEADVTSDSGTEYSSYPVNIVTITK